MLRKMFNFKKHNEVDKDKIAQLLKIDKTALAKFEDIYKSTSLENIDNGFFTINSKQASAMKENIDTKDYEKEINGLTNRIVNELIELSNKINSNKSLSMEEQFKLSNQSINSEIEILKPVTIEEINTLPKEMRPQVTGRLIQKDIKEDAYLALLNQYLQWKETGKQMFYHSFRQGLDILDLDPITYEIIGMNPNSMGYWLPEVELGISNTNFFKSPKTKVIKVPLPILQLTRLDYTQHTPTTLQIVNDFCMKAFDLNVNKKYFIKTGTYSSKFDFRNALVQGEQEVRELGEYLLFIHHQALQMAGPLSSPCIYGVSTTNEWVVREFIDDVEDNPTIYKGMPLHTEYRVFVDFDNKEILGVSPYWREDVMKKSFTTGEIDNHKKHDYIIYQMHEETLYNRYNENVDRILDEIKELIKHMNLPGQWSIDIMQNGEDFYIIDLAQAHMSALNDCIEENKLKAIEEQWIPQLKGEIE